MNGIAMNGPAITWMTGSLSRLGLGGLYVRPALAVFVFAVLLLFAPSPALAGSCCGGGGGAALVLPKTGDWMMDLSFDMEVYDGYWNRDGKILPDPPGSDLRQYRLNLGYGKRIADRWQISAVLPMVRNENFYENSRTTSTGPGDTTLTLLYETFDVVTCVWSVETLEDLIPAAYLGLGLTLPTGVSPFDEASRSFDVTGRGFYRLDASASVEKTIWPWTVAMAYSYGIHFERPVNREYGHWVEPYNKKLGDRRSFSLSGGYTYFMESDDTITLTVSYSDLWEGVAVIDGEPDPATGLRKRSVSAVVAFANMDKSFMTKLGYSRAVKQDDWGENFPITDILTAGVTYVF
ncbi:MAG: hypothetical protein OEZ55_09430 [Nitrospinota bacterium]|nr:hypothetical protein [Nitrospinota bacterium]MDH5756876.1 hypothetical protein [Nitrospinota bacterium]